MMKHTGRVGLVVLVSLLPVHGRMAAAFAQSSSNYKMVSQVFSQAGEVSASTSYRLRDCLGQPSVTGESNNGLWMLDGGFLGLRLPTATMALNFAAGWSWVSFYVKPENLTMEQVFSGMQHLVIAVNGTGQFYIPNVVNSIGNLDVRQGYKVYFSAPDQLQLTGSWASPITPIELSAGWNFISYLAAGDLDAAVALQSILSDLTIAKDDAGNFFVPGVINTLGQMASREGYKVYMKKSATLVYPLIAGGNNSAPTLAEVPNVRKVHESQPSRLQKPSRVTKSIRRH